MIITEFEPAISGRERPQTHALNRAATGIGSFVQSYQYFEKNTLKKEVTVSSEVLVTRPYKLPERNSNTDRCIKAEIFSFEFIILGRISERTLYNYHHVLLRPHFPIYRTFGLWT
jgi:hypothetical protein